MFHNVALSAACARIHWAILTRADCRARKSGFKSLDFLPALADSKFYDDATTDELK